jgi:hypothetical protein
MAPTILIAADGFARDELASRLGPAATPFAAGFLADTVAIARSLAGARVVVRYGPHFPRAALAGLAADVAVAPIVGLGGSELAEALGEALAEGGPALLLGADVPHLPPWRLRDALTHLDFGADAVIGPSDQGDWYLLGLRAPAPELLRRIPSRGVSPAALWEAGRSGRRRVVALPAWFAISSGAGLADLAEVLHSMPPGVASRTRALFESGLGSARAVGG